MTYVRLLALLAVVTCSTAAPGDILRWDTGEVIPGTEGIEPASGAQLAGLDLSFADLALAMLDGASLAGTTLDNALLDDASLAGADFSNAVIVNGSFTSTTANGFTKEQLYSTASYADMDLSGMFLNENNLSGWDFSGQNLSFTDLSDSMLGMANFSNANLTSAKLFGSTLTDANFTDAIISSADLAGSGLTAAQLESTKSYQQKNLQDIFFSAANLAGADLTGQDLSGSDLSQAQLAGAIFTDAIVGNTSFRNTTASGFAKEQLYATAGYKQKDLQAIELVDNDLSGWDFSNQNLTNTRLDRTNLAGAIFAGAVLQATALTSATNFTKEQLYTTASYQARNLRRVRFDGLSLAGWDLSNQDLRSTRLLNTNLADTNLSMADLRGAASFQAAETTITRNMIDPDSIVTHLNLQSGETLVAHAGPELDLPIGFFGQFSIDFDAKIDLTDNTAIVYNAPASGVRIQLIAGRNKQGLGGLWNGNGITSSTAAAVNLGSADERSIGYARNGNLPLGAYQEFHNFPVEGNSVLLAYTRTGDANLDGVVDDDDVTIISATYAPGVDQPEWALGDFDYNGFVDDDDVTLLGAFYNPDAAPAAATGPGVEAVPEPSALALVGVLLIGFAVRQRRRRRQ